MTTGHASTAQGERAQRRRTFFTELGSIVLGVLIALALGAVATAVGWRVDAADARRALSLELGEIIGQGEERVLRNACIEARLDAIGKVLDEAGRSGRLPPLGSIGSPMFRTWSHGVWDSTISADIASHMDRDTLDNLSGVYEFVGIINREAAKEIDTYTDLHALVGPGRAIAAEEVVSMRRSLAHARMSHRMIVMSAERLHQVADAYDLPYDRNTVAEVVGDRTALIKCAPFKSPAGEGYGQAPFANVLGDVRANPIVKGK